MLPSRLIYTHTTIVTIMLLQRYGDNIRKITLCVCSEFSIVKHFKSAFLDFICFRLVEAIRCRYECSGGVLHLTPLRLCGGEW